MPKVKKKDIDISFNYQKKPSYKCLCYYDYNNRHTQIFRELGKISKSVYNLSIYSIQIFNYFKIELYSHLYDKLLIDKSIDTDSYIKNELIKYFDLYSSINKHIMSNNNYIYKYIINYVNNNNIVIKNSNYDNVKEYIFNTLSNDQNIFTNQINDNLLRDDIINRIVNSIYTKNYRKTENEMLNHKKYTINDQEIINDIKNKNIKNFTIENTYKKRIFDELNIELKSDQNYIGRLVYAKLGDLDGKLNSTMIGSLISKAYQAYTSYYSLLEKGIKARHPKFLAKDDIYTLIYAYSDAIKINDNQINIYTSNYISKNYDKIFGDNYIQLANNKYIDKKYLLNKPKEKITKKENYLVDSKYVNKYNKNIIDSRYVTLFIPKKICTEKIKIVEIVFENNIVKICFSYENNNETKTGSTIIESHDSISIDMGVKNLMTIYNPTSDQNIISGGFILSQNNWFANRISEAQSNNNDLLVNKLNFKRKNIINNYFNLIVKWMSKEYSDKQLIIIGYNKEWKNGSQLGKINNARFNKIPYCKLIEKIKNKFINENKIVILTEESYTSKCDALMLEEICKKDKYGGSRIKRGLYSSSSGKLINADLNGAINIMRKIYPNIKEINGYVMYNPRKINIFRETRTADKV